MVSSTTRTLKSITLPWPVYFSFSSAYSTRLLICVKKETRVVIPGGYNRMMTRIIKPDVAPGEFKCRTCYTMWSSYMENHFLCTDTTERYGLRFYEPHNLNI